MKNNELTPIVKLLKNLSSLRSQSSLKKPVVLVTDGSMNPVHKQHIHNFEIAKEKIENSDLEFQVVAGYISPSTSIYVKEKLGEEAIDDKNRLEMVRLAVEDSPWIEVDEQGVNFLSGNALDKMQYLENYLNSNQEILGYCNGVKLFYLCGSDLIKRDIDKDWKLIANLVGSGYKVVIVRRGNNTKWEDECKTDLDLTFGVNKQWSSSVFLADNHCGRETSSTKVRNIIKGKEKGRLEELLPLKVLEHIKKNKIIYKEEVMTNNKKPMLILVAGGTASAKTILVKEICEKSGKSPITLGTDDYVTIKIGGFSLNINGVLIDDEMKKKFGEDISEEWVEDKYVEYNGEYEWCKLENVNWNELIKKVEWELSKPNSNKIVILEGIHALQNEKLRSMADFKVYSDVEDDLRLISKITRSPYYKEMIGEDADDTRNFGGSNNPFPNAFKSWKEGTKPGEKKYVLPTKQHADLIISGDNQNQKEFAENVRKICDFIDLYFENEESFKEKVLEITKQKIDEYSLEKLIEARVRIQNLEEENQIKEKELSELREQLRVLQENSQLETKIERLNK